MSEEDVRSLREDVIEHKLTNCPESIRVVRELVAEALMKLGLEQLCEAVKLVASEIATNVCRYGRCEMISVVIRMLGDKLRIEFPDNAKANPVTQPESDDAESGRGLQLVEFMADDWGVDARSDGETGKVTWCEFAVSGQAA